MPPLRTLPRASCCLTTVDNFWVSGLFSHGCQSPLRYNWLKSFRAKLTKNISFSCCNKRQKQAIEIARGHKKVLGSMLGVRQGYLNLPEPALS